MCRANLRHTFRHHITSASLFRRLGILDIDSYYRKYRNRIFRWAGYVARMPMSRAPRQLLTEWISRPRPISYPQLTWVRVLESTLNSKGISKEFNKRIAIARDRPKLRQTADSLHPQTT